jgi:hypothetical protein
MALLRGEDKQVIKRSLFICNATDNQRILQSTVRQRFFLLKFLVMGFVFAVRKLCGLNACRHMYWLFVW